MIRDITIKAVLNGFIVTVGCQQVVFASVEALEKDLGLYLRDPETSEKHYRENSINAKHVRDETMNSTATSVFTNTGLIR